MDEAAKVGCCDGCGGTGLVGWAAVETNGRCWDCYGTGHAHSAGLACISLALTDLDRARSVAVRAGEGYCINCPAGSAMTVVTGCASPIDPSPTYTFTCPTCGAVGYIE